MSYDYELWSAKGLPAAQESCRQLGLSSYLGSFAYETDAWQVVVERPVAVEPSEVPAQVKSIQPDAKFMTSVTLEPIGAPREGYEMLHSICARLCADLGGVVTDPQQEALYYGPNLSQTVKFP